MGLLKYYKRNTTLYPDAKPLTDINISTDYYLTTIYSLLSGTTTYNVNNIPLITFPSKLYVPVQKAAYNGENLELTDIYDIYEYDVEGSFAKKIIDPVDSSDNIYFLIKYQLTTEQFNKVQLSLEKANYYNDSWRKLPTIFPLQANRQYSLYDLPSSLDTTINLNTKAFVQSDKAVYLIESYYNSGVIFDPYKTFKVHFSLIYHLKKDGVITIPNDAESLIRFLEPYRNGATLDSNLVFPKDYIPNYDRTVLYGDTIPSSTTPLNSVVVINNTVTPLTTAKQCSKKALKKLLIKLPAGLAERFNVTEWLEGQFLRLYLLPEEYSYVEEGEKSKYSNTFSNYRVLTRIGRVGFSVNSQDLNNDKLRAIISYLSRISISTTYDKQTPITVIDYCRPDDEDKETAYISQQEPYTVRNGIINMGSMTGTIGYSNDNYNQGLQFTFMETKLRLLL